jgi:hypothetical protein
MRNRYYANCVVEYISLRIETGRFIGETPEQRLCVFCQRGGKIEAASQCSCL